MHSKIGKYVFTSFLLLVFAVAWAGNVFALKLKKTIAVSRFENKTNYSGQINLGDGMADQLADALVQSGGFVVLERQTLDDVFAEQDLAASGRSARSKTAQIGKIIPAQILIKGTVTEFESRSSGGGAGIGFGGFSIGGSKSEAHVGIIVRIIDSSTGEVLDSVRVEGKAKSEGLAGGIRLGGLSFGAAGFNKTPLGKAMHVTIRNAVTKIAQRLSSVPYAGKIIKVTPDTVFTSIGLRNGVSVGDVLTVFSPGEEFIDPDTGENLGSDKTKMGTIKIISAKEKFSKATVASGGSFHKGDIVTE